MLEITNRIKKLILKNEFSKAKEIAAKIEVEELQHLLHGYSYKEEINDCKIYRFITYIIKTEKNSKNIIKYHLLASRILSLAMPFLSFSFEKAIFHAKKTVELNPKSISLKENLLFIYRDPNAEDFMSEKEAEKIAKEVLKEKPDSSEAKEALECIKHRKKKQMHKNDK